MPGGGGGRIGEENMIAAFLDYITSLLDYITQFKLLRFI